MSPVSRDRILEFLKNHFQQKTTEDTPSSLSTLKDFRSENLCGENVTVQENSRTQGVGKLR